jgi:hypothetical protein
VRRADHHRGKSAVAQRGQQTACFGSTLPRQRAAPADVEEPLYDWHLATVLSSYTEHYNEHRAHRSLGQRPLAPRSDVTDLTAAKVKRRSIWTG